MGRPKVSITLANGGLGITPSTADGVAGLCVVGVAKAGCALLAPKQVFSLADFEALGFAAATDATDGTETWAQVRDFYEVAGTGKTLWVMVYAATTTQANLADKTNTSGVRKLLDAAGGKIRVLGVSRHQAPGYTPTVTNGLEGDVYTAATNAQALEVEYEGKYQPFVALLDGRDFAGTAANLTDLTSLSLNAVGIVMGNRTGLKNAAIGLFLGKLASVPVMRKISRRKDAPVAYLSYLTNGAAIETFSDGTRDSLHDKGFLFLETQPGKAGYWANGDATATAATDDYRGLARRRTINKCIELTAVTYLTELDDEVHLDAKTGKLSPSLIGHYRGQITAAINRNMVDAGELDGISVSLDANQNVLATNQVSIGLGVVPVGYSSSILVKVGFYNPAS